MIFKRENNSPPPVAKIILLLFAILIFTSCSAHKAVAPVRSPEVSKKDKIAPLGFTIQAGAFSNLENAVRLTDYLNHSGLEAYYFVYKSGLYKVRFGNYATKAAALSKARELKESGVIEEYYIVRPDEFPFARKGDIGESRLRKELVKTARSFLGVPYKWGAASAREGFDCSGLAMSVYRLNGFDLPRTSWRQYEAGEAVDFNSISEGDLVFFDTKGRGSVSHVGIYAGEGNFIHAPGTGKRVRIEAISNGYYRKRYMGARSYL